MHRQNLPVSISMRISISSCCSSQVCLLLHSIPSCHIRSIPLNLIYITKLRAYRRQLLGHHPSSLQLTECLSRHCSTKQITTTELIITMSHYSASRLQTLCRLGVEQLPSLCADRDFDDMGPSSTGKRANYEGIFPLAGNLPVRTIPVSR